MDAQRTFVKSIGAVANGASVTLQSNTKYLAVTLWDSSDDNVESFEAFIALLSNLTLKPFICLSSETDKTYEEYNEDTQTILTTAKFGSRFININKINEI